MNVIRHATCVGIAAIVAAGSATTAAAQGSCDINLNRLPRPAQTGFITLSQTGGSEQQQKSVRDAVRAVTAPGNRAEQVVTDYYLARSLFWFATQAEVGPQVTRGQLGWADRTEEQIDLYRELDRLFTSVEQAREDCRPEMAQYRQFIWANGLNAAIQHLNHQGDSAAVAAHRDTAVTLLNRSNAVNPDAPQGYFLLAYHHQSQGNHQQAEELLTRTLQLASAEAVAADTSLIGVRRDAMLNLASVQSAAAEQLPEGPQQQAAAKRAVATFNQFLQAYPDAEEAARVRAALPRMLSLTGDESAVQAVREQMLTSPTNFSDHQLLEAGAEAYNANDRDRAAKLFAGALEVNPYNRLALFNLTNTYNALKRWPQVIETGKRYLQQDPNNKTVIDIVAFAHQEQGRAPGTAAAARQQHADSAQAYASRSKTLPVSIRFEAMEMDGQDIVVRGVVENHTRAARNDPLRFEFLNREGQVVSRAETTVQNTAQGQSPFEVKAAGQGVAGFRYAPIGASR